MINLHRSTALRTAALLLLLLTMIALPASADDRDLVREGGRVPYLMVLFDVSGSMNWQPGGDGFAPAYGDDPNSKFYQAKSALYRVVSDPELDDIFWGFATYNQDEVRAYRKHWIYTPSTSLNWVNDDRLPYPAPGVAKHFGDSCMDDNDGNTDCDLDGNDQLGTCGGARDVDNAEDFGEIVTFPITGDTGANTTEEWVRHNGRRFYVTYNIAGGALGDETIDVRVQLREARNDCAIWLTNTESQTIQFERLYTQDLQGRNLPGGNQMLYWQIDDSTDSAGNPNGFFSPDDTRAANTCEGWDPNDDAAADDTAGVNLKYPRTSDPDSRHSWVMDRGDVIPLDWESEEVWGVSNKDTILQRLAPNYDPNDPSIVPDFRVASYFQDNPNTLFNGRLELDPLYVNTPPLLPNGATPIGNSMRDFMDFYDTWEGVATGPDGDENFGCRSVNLLIITDGDETCYGGTQTGTTDGGGDANPCWIADRLLTESNRDIKTYVIGFGLQGQATNFLDCIAENGGTDEIDTDGDGVPDITGPILPGNEDELVDALKSVIQSIRAQERSFAAAAVPQGQATVQDKAYLTSFLPLESESIWPGRLDAYLRPIPLKDAQIELPDGTTVTRQVPDPDQECSTGDDSSCHLWNAGEEILEQAASDADIALGDYNLGNGERRRRVYWGRDRGDVPLQRRNFKRPGGDGTWRDLLIAMDICPEGSGSSSSCVQDLDNRDEANETLDFFHEVKNAVDPRTSDPIDYLLGDIFHSDPAVIGNPDTFRYWVADVAGSGALPLEDMCTVSPTGYRCFFAKQQFRRKMLFTGSNDGQLHAFDAGIFRGTCESSPSGQQFVAGEFDDGTGREIFSFVPKSAMPDLVSLKDGLDHQFTVDGRVSSGDIFIDPSHGGTPDEDEREWRSIIMTGLREGGKGYFALDITQPDDLDECGGLPVLPKPRSGSLEYVPSCVSGTCDDTLTFPSALFEFTDRDDCGEDGSGDPLELADGQCDSDENGLADLGDAWSRPVITRIQVSEDVGGTLETVDKYVAIFGGGSDPERKSAEEAEGNHIFMIDLETGKAIFKRRVPDAEGVPSGSVASDLAAVDLDQDGYTDTVYFGTVGGFLYKMDIRSPAELESVPSAGLKVTDSAWDPFPVFDTGGRSIYFEPAVVFVAELGQYAVSFGTGDREDLWSETLQEGRVYMLLDRNFSEADVTSGLLPKDESSYQEITLGTTNTTTDYLQQAPYGWYIRLDEDERVITRSFSLAGITVISSFQPLEESSDGGICRRYGNSRVTVVTTTSGNALLESGDRFFLVPAGFLSTPFAEVGQTKNPDGGGSNSDDLPDNLENVIDEIKKLFPSNCRFANYTINIKAVRDDTGIEFLAAVPVCTFETNWRDY